MVLKRFIFCVSSIIMSIKGQFTNDPDRPGAQLIVLAAPERFNRYYSDSYNDIINFHIQYAKEVMGKDNVVILGDKYAIDLYRAELPDDILLEEPMYDIWMRDFTSVDPYSPVSFKYTPASSNSFLARKVQRRFDKFANNLGLQIDRTPASQGYLNDGGNVVDNYAGGVILTDRFLDDNYLTEKQGIQYIKRQTGAQTVLFLPQDDPKGLGHIDGMVSFIDDNAALVTNYQSDPTFKSQIWSKLQENFPGIQLIEDADNWRPGNNFDRNIENACSLMVNGVLTQNYLYVPTFGNPTDESILDSIRSSTSRTVVPIEASKVCSMGGSVRCLSWQQTGSNAKRIIEAARQ